MPRRACTSRSRPERVFSGRVLRDLATYPKLVGGLDADGEARAVELYALVHTDAEVWPMGSAEAAELTKLAETTYRDLNIAFANELARARRRRWASTSQRVIDAANSQPYSHIHRPGVAVGGHCIPVYPRFYLAGDARAQLPRRRARRSTRRCPPTPSSCSRSCSGGLDGTRVLILGVAYRGGVKETAFSGAFPLRDALRGPRRAGRWPPTRSTTTPSCARWASSRGTASPSRAAIVQADHAEYETLEIPRRRDRRRPRRSCAIRRRRPAQADRELDDPRARRGPSP